jgi:undecaprenyl-diphosphatase
VTHRVGWLDWLFVGLSRIGTLGAVWIAIALVLAIVWRRPTLFGLVLLAALVADVAALAGKDTIPRDRPPVRYPEPHALVKVPADHSFPSGHTATSFACALVLARAAPRLRVPLFALAAAIGLSRVYVGVHYPLDVLGGAVLGLLVGAAVPRVLPLLEAALPRSRRPRRSG